MERRDLSPVQGSEVGVEPHRLLFQGGQFLCQSGLACLQFFYFYAWAF